MTTPRRVGAALAALACLLMVAPAAHAGQADRACQTFVAASQARYARYIPAGTRIVCYTRGPGDRRGGYYAWAQNTAWIASDQSTTPADPSGHTSGSEGWAESFQRNMTGLAPYWNYSAILPVRDTHQLWQEASS